RLVIVLGWLGHYSLLSAALLRRCAGLVMRTSRQIGRDEDDRAETGNWRIEPTLDGRRSLESDDEDRFAAESEFAAADDFTDEDQIDEPEPPRPTRNIGQMTKPRPGRRVAREAQRSLLPNDHFELPPLQLLAEPRPFDRRKALVSADA